MLNISAERIRELLDWSPTIDAIEQMFRQDCRMPTRHHHTLVDRGARSPVTLLMPAWIPDKYLGVKTVNVFPDNAALGKPAVSGVYLLFSGETGEILAVLEGGELTARRTAAASALAARFLARPDASRLLVVGTGRLSRNLARAHASVRPIRRVAVWGRHAARAAAVAQELREAGLDAHPVDDLARAAGEADVISCATLSSTPLVRGEWLRPGVHLDLVGGFTPAMRETDDEAIRRASVFVDTRAGATREAGDIVVPLANGSLRPEGIRADLFDLARGTHGGRTDRDEITLFKSVGAALEDLAAAILVFQRSTRLQGVT